MKIFQENKFEKWWDSLPKHTQEYLKSQPIWYDSDLYKTAFIAFAFGFLLGALIF